MRTQITFVVRLWVKPGHADADPGWIGQVECVSTGEQLRFRKWERLLAFLVESGTRIGRPDARQRDDASLRSASEADGG